MVYLNRSDLIVQDSNGLCIVVLLNCVTGIGNTVPSQFNPVPSFSQYYGAAQYSFHFLVNLPPLGFGTYFFAVDSQNAVVGKSQTVTGATVSNNFYSASFSSETGRLERYEVVVLR
jgi:hypothetical protein